MATRPLVAVDARPLQGPARYQGIGTYTRGLLEGLAEVADPASVVLFVEEEEDASVPAKWPFRQIHIARPRRPRRLQELWNFLLTPRGLARVGASVYHAPVPELAVPAAPCARVVTVHDVVAFRPGSHYLRTGVKYRMLYRAAASADRVVVPSERTRADFAELFHPKSVVTVPEAVPKSFRRPITDSELWEVRAQFGLDGPFLLAVGDLGGGPHTDRKNLKALVSAFASLGSVAESWTLVFAGKRGDHTAELERLAHGLGCGDRVRFLGYVDATQLPAVYVAAELLVYPSLYEGFGLPALEALAVGTPVLATADAVADEFIGGCVHQTGPEEQRLKASLERLMASSELRRQFVDRGRQSALSRSWNDVAGTMMEIYQLLARQ